MMNRRKGFTLIELLVVIAIIAILAAILYPVFKKIRDRAINAHCISNLQQIGKAMILYKDDYDGAMVPWWLPAYPNGETYINYAITGYHMQGLLDPYLKTKEVWDHEPKGTRLFLWGPSVIGAGIGAIGNTSISSRPVISDYSANPVVHWRHINNLYPDVDIILSGGIAPTAWYTNPGYGRWAAGSVVPPHWTDINWDLVVGEANEDGDGSFKGWGATLHESEINQPANLVSLADSLNTYIDVGPQLNAVVNVGRHWLNYWYSANFSGYEHLAFRHFGRANLLFCDGHVSYMDRAMWARGQGTGTNGLNGDPTVGVRMWNNSPYEDGRIYNRMHTYTSADDKVLVNTIQSTQLNLANCCQGNYYQGGPPLWTRELLNYGIFHVDATDGEYNTPGRPMNAGYNVYGATAILNYDGTGW